MENFTIFLGRFHPLVVHLPIGILMLAFAMWGLDFWKKTNRFQPAIQFSLLLGAISAVVACAIGYLLSLSGGYDDTMLDQHMWAGIATSVFSIGAYLFSLSAKGMTYLKVLMPIIMLGLGATGHIGGSLTHGETYLTEYAPFIGKEELVIPTDINEVVLFDHVVQPILDAKCASCHNSGKKKGQLSLETQASILKGGKHGKVITARVVSDSELISRLFLPEDHDDVMPPKGKPKLTELETSLLVSWIKNGASFDQKAVALNNDTLTNLTSAYLNQEESTEDNHGQASKLKTLPAIDEGVLLSLNDKGFLIREVVAGTNRLDVTFPPYQLSDDYGAREIVEDLRSIANHVVILNLSGINLADEDLKLLGDFPVLEKLKLNENPITDAGLSSLKLPKLTVLNLHSTQITDSSMAHLAKLNALKRIYVWNTQVKNKDDRFELIF
ncbi:MAG: hypothetical protein JXR10_13015 [Cyclobacteriaceae bacterium]